MKTKFTFLVLLMSLQITLGQTNFFKNQAERHPDISIGTAQAASQLRHTDIILQSLDSIYGKIWDQRLNDWVNNGKDILTYDATGNIIDITSQNWDLSTNTWKNSMKIAYTYNVNGKISLIDMQQWNNTSGQWENGMQVLFTYDTNNNLTERIDQYWDNGQWNPEYKDVFTYNNQGQMIERISYENSDMPVNWLQEDKLVNVYDSNNRRTEETVYDWDDTNQVWIEEEQNVYTYQSDLLMSCIRSNWDQTTTSFLEDSKAEYTYDTDDYLIEIIQSDWDDTSQQWENGVKTVYTRDAQHNIIEEIRMNWNNNNWVNEEKYLRNYNNNFTYDDLLLPEYYYEMETTYFFKFLFVHQLIEEIRYNWHANTWEASRKTDFYYSSKDINGISSTEQIVAKIFPNPFTQSLQIQLPENLSQSQFTLYDLTGKQIMSVKISQNGIVNLPKLEQNIYLYKISGKDFEQTGKLIRK